MDIQLFRIDDRLIHGQVVLGWANYLQSKRIFLCDNLVVQNEWEKELYLSCVPSHLQSVILSIHETTSYLLNESVPDDKTIVLVRSPRVLIEIAESGFSPRNVNLGGMHYMENRRQYLPYVFLSDEDINDIKILINMGISIYCQDLPTSKKYNILDVLKN